MKFVGDWNKLEAKICFYRQSGTKYFAKIRNSSKIAPDQETLITNFAQDFTARAKNDLLEGKLHTSLSLHSIMMFSFQLSLKSMGNSKGNLYTKFVILDIKFCFTSRETNLHGKTV